MERSDDFPCVVHTSSANLLPGKSRRPCTILFKCGWCGKSLLASSGSTGEYFHCPGCEGEVSVPEQGKQIEIVERKVQEVSSPDRHTTSPSRAASRRPQDSDQDCHFMSTWGDYMAADGLAETDEKEPRGSDQVKSPPLSVP